MVDERIEEWIKREFNRWGDYIRAVDERITAVDKRCLECRTHCDAARDSCSLKHDHEDRIRHMEKRQDECEKQVAINTASSWKGAKLIGACTLTAGLTTAIITLARWFIK